MKMTEAQKILPLPKGWRWLQPGECVHVGDMMHDRRANPVKIEFPSCGTEESAYRLTEEHHPVRTKLRWCTPSLKKQLSEFKKKFNRRNP